MKEKIKIILITAIIGFFILVTMTIFVNETERNHLVSLFMFCIFVFYIGYEKIKKRIKK